MNYDLGQSPHSPLKGAVDQTDMAKVRKLAQPVSRRTNALNYASRRRGIPSFDITVDSVHVARRFERSRMRFTSST